MNSLKSLKLEIHSKNESNRIILLIIANLLPQLAPFLNKKITTLSGFSKKFVMDFLKPKVNLFENEGFASIVGSYLDVKHNCLYLNLRLCFNGGSYDVQPTTAYTKYTEQRILLGNVINNETLTHITNFDDLVRVYGAENDLDIAKELAAIKVYKMLAEQLAEAKKDIKIDAEYYKYL